CAIVWARSAESSRSAPRQATVPSSAEASRDEEPAARVKRALEITRLCAAEDARRARNDLCPRGSAGQWRQGYAGAVQRCPAARAWCGDALSPWFRLLAR